MKIVQINATCDRGSTGKICSAVSVLLTAKGIENYILYTGGHVENKYGFNYAGKWYLKGQALLSRINGNYGFNSVLATKKLINKLKSIGPDIIHLHNIHGHNCNIELLFSYIRDNNIKLYWTFHDCWAFTGYCPHFTMVNCNKWKNECNHCIQRKHYSWFLDKSSELYQKKKKLFSGLNLTIITPSQWLADVVGESFLKEYPVFVINNGIKLDIFKPRQSNFREKYGVENKKIVLGVAYKWDDRKGLGEFIELGKLLGDEYAIVLVGTDDSIDKILPNNIISIHRTTNQCEMAEIYSAANVFVNLTKEDTFPTVNIESLACGTPVITNKVGGSAEIISTDTGISVDEGNIQQLLSAIQYMCEANEEIRLRCTMRASQFNSNDKFDQYIEMYLR